MGILACIPACEKKADGLPTASELEKISADHEEYVRREAIVKLNDEYNKWLETLDDDEKYYDTIAARDARAEAMNARLRGYKAAADAAKREADIAEIETDPNKSEVDKIREVAAIREKGFKAKADAAKKELMDASIKAEAVAKAANEKAVREASDVVEIEKLRKELEARIAEIEAR